MNVLVTGASGFIGKNLIAVLKNQGIASIFEFDKDNGRKELEEYCRKCDFIFHLASVNGPEINDEFMDENYGFTETLIETLTLCRNKCPIVVASSIQAEMDNPYGKSKQAGEILFEKYAKSSGAIIMIYRLPNVFGKWAKPNNNSDIASFCHNIAREIEIYVSDRNHIVDLVYIDGVCEAFIKSMQLLEMQDITVYRKTLGAIVDIIYSFKESRKNLYIPLQSDGFVKSLYATYLSFLPEDDFGYRLKTNINANGSFTEILKTHDYGQVSVNHIKSDATKGNHYHHTKNEKFLVVKGKVEIKFRKLGEEKILKYVIADSEMIVVDIPCGYTHSIRAIDGDAVVIMWANSVFDPNDLDTFYEEVEK